MNYYEYLEKANIDKHKTIKVSVIMPAYNSEKYIAGAIESILRQTLKELELIIIDDYSTDNTPRILKNYLDKDKRIKYIKNDKNIGSGPSRNKALKIAKGKYIALMDADDTCSSNRFEIQYKYLEKNPDIFMVCTGSFDLNENGKKTRFCPITNELKLKKRMIKNNSVYGPTAMFKNFEECLFREKFIYAQDYDFSLRMLSDGKRIKNIFLPLYNYNINSNSVSWGLVDDRIKQKTFAKIAKKYYFERILKGRDSYNRLNIDEVMLKKYSKNSKEYIESEIEIYYKYGKKRTTHCSKKIF
jgi:glycosyltransferase involved in cell wall biosynthesis